MSLDEWKSLGATEQAIEDNAIDRRCCGHRRRRAPVTGSAKTIRYWVVGQNFQIRIHEGTKAYLSSIGNAKNLE